MALSGESGAGKSTLAAALEKRGLPRLAHDLLPVGVDGGEPVCFPRFRQPGLGLHEQVGPGVPEVLPLIAVLFLDPVRGVVDAMPLESPAAVLALARATAAVTLSPPDLLSRHMEVCAGVAGGAEVLSLGYPHRPGSIEAVQRLAESRWPG